MLAKHSYCVKCHANKTVIGQHPVTMKNGALALKGECPSCKSASYKIVAKDAMVQEATRSKAMRSPDLRLFVATASFILGLGIGAFLAGLI